MYLMNQVCNEIGWYVLFQPDVVQNAPTNAFGQSARNLPNKRS